MGKDTKKEMTADETKTAEERAALRQSIFSEIEEERIAQDREWGGPDKDDKLTPNDWKKKIVKQVKNIITGFGTRRDAFVKIAALSVAAIEAYDRWAKR